MVVVIYITNAISTKPLHGICHTINAKKRKVLFVFWEGMGKGGNKNTKRERKAHENQKSPIVVEGTDRL